jgi:hypothetical protein
MRMPSCSCCSWSCNLHHIRLYVYVCYEALGVEHNRGDVLPAGQEHLRQVKLGIGRKQRHHPLVVRWCVCPVEVLHELNLIENICWRVARQHH